MIDAPSITRRLTRSMAVVGGLGALLLLIVIGIEYRLSFSHVSSGDALPLVLHELAEHVLLPMVVLIVPMALAGRWAIRRAIEPLRTAAAEIDARADAVRGVRVATDTLPMEARPFADAINRMLGRADHAASMHEGFAADIAHELRTPLTLLSLELDRLDAPQAPHLREAVAQMRRLIDQLMLLAQVEADAASLSAPSDVDLVDLAGDVIARMAPLALDQGVHFELVAGDRVLAPGRREAIGAALRNLLENALRVTPPGGTIVVRVTAQGLIAVRDEGPGLDTQALVHLVERHHRADYASKDGAGLGLAIVDRIMKAHGGSLGTAPEEGEIRLHLPVSG
ncbi:HAMP domain-containing histidine kinase [Sphingomonas sp. S1-29]|uniref:sensor histidine kinase n=1 Tax=Sphingomonas sp. S1-29 TaxID=2991074 RepID=UPI00224014D5|nr:HAMP domain-containing sensor histidine kinase [Sphingomonas sp. S1-29]UZK70578.1 HAMP domain-containing histidine kinase [Sphingomonas sp. S1-29]